MPNIAIQAFQASQKRHLLKPALSILSNGEGLYYKGPLYSASPGEVGLNYVVSIPQFIAGQLVINMWQYKAR